MVGSRGLSGLDAHFLGSVSKQIVNFADCTVTVVH
ncbi:MAG: universal stress protein [Bifidobacterium pseudocatenulatum]